MTLPRASRSVISPVVTETERQKKAKELPAQSSPSPLLLCVPLASSQCWAGPGQSSCRLPCAQLAVIRLFLLGGGGVGGGGRDGGAGWGVETGMRCTVGASEKAVGRERALLSSSAMREKRENDAGRMCVDVGSVSVSINKERYLGFFCPLSVCPLGCLLQCSSACLFVSFSPGLR